MALGLAADARGVVCDASCRVFDADGMVLDDVFVAGDVARWPHPLFDGQLLAVEHWDNAVEQAADRRPQHGLRRRPSAAPTSRCPPSGPTSSAYNIKSVGLPTVADEVVVTQGSVQERRFVAVYGRAGRIVAAVAVNAPRWLEFYEALIEARAPFPPVRTPRDGPAEPMPVPAGFPPHGHATHSPAAVAPGRRVRSRPEPPCRCRRSDPRVPPGTLSTFVASEEKNVPRRPRTRREPVRQVLDPANRPNPYPLYARLRETPVSLQADGTYVVSTYAEIAALLHDPRISSDERKSAGGAGALVASGRLWPEGRESHRPFIFLDPPDHDRLRRLVMRQFTPARVEGMHGPGSPLVDGLLDAQRGKAQSTSSTTSPTRCR